MRTLAPGSGGRPRPGFPACYGPLWGPRINSETDNPQKTADKLQVVNYRLFTSSGSSSAEHFFKSLIICNLRREFFSVDNFRYQQTYPQKKGFLSTDRLGSSSAENRSWKLRSSRELFSGTNGIRSSVALSAIDRSRSGGRGGSCSAESCLAKPGARELFSGVVQLTSQRSQKAKAATDSSNRPKTKAARPKPK